MDDERSLDSRKAVFTTSRLVARNWTTTPEDVASAFAIYSNPEVSKFIRDAPEESLETQKATLERILKLVSERDPRFGWWALEEKSSGRIVGISVLKPLPDHDEVEVGWHLGREFWGMGYAAEGAKGAIRHFFGKFDLPRIVAVVNPENSRSSKVAVQLGMELEGMVHVYNIEAEFYTLTRERAKELGYVL